MAQAWTEQQRVILDTHAQEQARYENALGAEKARQEFALAQKIQEKRQQRLIALQRHADREAMKTAQSNRRKGEQVDLVRKLFAEHEGNHHNQVIARAAEESRQRNELRLRLMQRKAQLAVEKRKKAERGEAEEMALRVAREQEERDLAESLARAEREEREQQARLDEISAQAFEQARNLSAEHSADQEAMRQALKLEMARQNINLRDKINARREQLQRQRQKAVESGAAQEVIEGFDTELESLAGSLASIDDLTSDEDIRYAIAKSAKVRDLAAMDAEIQALAEEEAAITEQYMQAQSERLSAENKRVQALEAENRRLAEDRERLEKMATLQREISDLRERADQEEANRAEIARIKQAEMDTAKLNTAAFVDCLPSVAHGTTAHDHATQEMLRPSSESGQGEYHSVLAPVKDDQTSEVWNPVFGGGGLLEDLLQKQKSFESDHEMALRLQREEQMRARSQSEAQRAAEERDAALARQLQQQQQQPQQQQGASAYQAAQPVDDDEALARRLQQQFDLEAAGQAARAQPAGVPQQAHYAVPVYPRPQPNYPDPQAAHARGASEDRGTIYTCEDDAAAEIVLKELAHRPILIEFYAQWSEQQQSVRQLVRMLSNKYPDVAFVRCALGTCPRIAGQHVTSVPYFRALKDYRSVGEVRGSNPVALETLVQSIAVTR